MKYKLGNAEQQKETKKYNTVLSEGRETVVKLRSFGERNLENEQKIVDERKDYKKMKPSKCAPPCADPPLMTHESLYEQNPTQKFLIDQA